MRGLPRAPRPWEISSTRHFQHTLTHWNFTQNFLITLSGSSHCLVHVHNMSIRQKQQSDDDTCSSDIRMWVNGALGCSYAVAKCVMGLLVSLSLESETLFDLRQTECLLFIDIWIFSVFVFRPCVPRIWTNFLFTFVRFLHRSIDILINTTSTLIYITILLPKIYSQISVLTKPDTFLLKHF